MTDTEQTGHDDNTPAKMASELISREANIAHFKVEVTSEEVSQVYRQLYREWAKEMNVKGFRKGKIPPNVIRQRVGAETVDEAAADAMKDVAIRKGLNQLELTARSGDPVWHTEAEVQDGVMATYEVSLPVLPVITLPDYASFEVTVPKLAVTDGMKDRYRERLAERYTDFPEKEGAAEEGDAFTIKLSSTYADSDEGSPFQHDQLLYALGKEGNLPGWDEKLLGHKAGETLEFKYTVPEDFQDPRVSNRELNIVMEITTVHSVVEPKIDVEFLKEKLHVDSMEEFDQFLSATLEHERDQQFEQMKRELVMQRLIEELEVEVSEDMINEEVDGLVKENDQSMRQHGSSLDEYLKQKSQELKDYRESLAEPALRKIKLFLALHEISAREGINASNDDYQRYAMMLMQRENIPPEQVQELFKRRDFFNETTYQIVKEKVLAHVAEVAKVKENVHTTEEAYAEEAAGEQSEEDASGDSEKATE